MKSFEYVIKDKLGIHARPAVMVVNAAKAFQSQVVLDKNGKTADAKRVMAVMGLAAKQGDTLIVRVEGEDEEAAAAAMQAFFENTL